MSRKRKTNAAVVEEPRLVREEFGGVLYEYVPLGKYVVAARGVCGGRPTIKYHRLDARHIIGYLKQGVTPEEIAADFKIPVAAVREIIKLADTCDYEASYV